MRGFEQQGGGEGPVADLWVYWRILAVVIIVEEQEYWFVQLTDQLATIRDERQHYCKQGVNTLPV